MCLRFQVQHYLWKSAKIYKLIILYFKKWIINIHHKSHWCLLRIIKNFHRIWLVALNHQIVAVDDCFKCSCLLFYIFTDILLSKHYEKASKWTLTWYYLVHTLIPKHTDSKMNLHVPWTKLNIKLEPLKEPKCYLSVDSAKNSMHKKHICKWF